MNATAGRIGALLRRGWHRVVTMPRGARLLLVALAVFGGFVGVVLPLFNSGGAARGEIAGQLPSTVAAGQAATADIAFDNVGDSIINPVCVTMSGDGTALVSADFQGLDHVTATENRVCGGQLTGQETIDIILHFTLSHRGTIEVRVVPQQGGAVIGPVFSGSVGVS
ncbi:MAG TPA: hypothetical protein VLO10_01665 [Candidatus Deferrimicrobium sp.]|nr:hypothetical protein [Candidatus Deferrimicrobium sp.]